MNEIMSRIINFDEKIIKNEKTGEVKTMYSVNYEVTTDSYEKHYGPTILNSYAGADAFELLKANIGKTIRIVVGEQRVYGKQNQYKKVVTKLNGKEIRNF